MKSKLAAIVLCSMFSLPACGGGDAIWEADYRHRWGGAVRTASARFTGRLCYLPLPNPRLRNRGPFARWSGRQGRITGGWARCRWLSAPVNRYA